MQTLNSPTSGSNTSYSHHPSLRLLALGDSLVYGYGDPVGGGWVERLRRQWMTPGAPNHALYNLGVRGDGVRQVARRLEDEFRNRGELRNRQPDLIILSVGINDSPRLARPDGRNFTEFAGFEIGMADLLDRARRLCPVVFVGMVPVDEEKMPFLDCLYYNHADQHRYKEATRLACESRQIPYLDLFDLWMSRGVAWCQTQLTVDGLHPNVAGYQTLLQDIMSWQALWQWLEKREA
ncbi:MAG: G-D-S-L family lipolytic protein [Leptolyngbyaceae cyanobacterium SU_3_3]|nr:G-D-S-L family lipolytic protein [Leptolyngbyaceae cyanobacterium SU_3_3]NJR51204.1 G-D-S-L family lipolytic protein [Leptolyngbyaceae cyanobacterium CSU_1_3]